MRSKDCGMYDENVSRLFTKKETLKMFQKMCLSRYFEIALKNHLDKKEMPPTLVYPSVGQESISSALAMSYSSEAIFAQHRCHDTYLAHGGDMAGLIDELLGLESGCARGMGGSASIHSDKIHMLWHDGHMGTQVPIGIEHSLQNNERALVVMGDASAEEGYAIGALARAGTKQSPSLLVCVDNGLSILTPVSERRSWEMVDIARAFGIQQCHEITDDPWLIMRIVRDLDTTKPAFFNIHTCRNWWHGGTGCDGPPEWDRFVLVKREIKNLGFEKDALVIEKWAEAFTAALWRERIRAINYKPVVAPQIQKEKRGPTTAETIREITREFLTKQKGLLYGQCLSAVGWIGGTVPELTEADGLREAPMDDVTWPYLAVGAALPCKNFPGGRRVMMAVRYQGFQWFNLSAIVNYAAKSKDMAETPCPVFVRSIAMDGGVGPVASGAHHGLAMRMPGIRIFAPMTPREYNFVWNDFVKNDDPVYCSEHRWSFPIDYEMDDVIENDADVTLVAISAGRVGAVAAREELQKEGIKCNIVHLVQLKPLDLQNTNWRVGEALKNSKYGGLVIDGDFEAGAAKPIAFDIFHAIGKPTYALGLEDRTAGFAPRCDNLPPTEKKIMAKVKEIITTEKSRE